MHSVGGIYSFEIKHVQEKKKATIQKKDAAAKIGIWGMGVSDGALC